MHTSSWMLFFSLVLVVAADAGEEKERTLFDFSEPESVKPWVAVNDGVMGGRSDGRFRITEQETLEFYGRLSLANNGGFASIRARGINLRLEEGDVLIARVRGDGRRYNFNLYTGRNGGGFSFRQSFETTKGKWIDVRLPVDKSVATWRGRVFADQKLDPSKASGLGFLLGDKKPGAFQLEVKSIRVAGRSAADAF